MRTGMRLLCKCLTASSGIMSCPVRRCLTVWYHLQGASQTFPGTSLRTEVLPRLMRAYAPGRFTPHALASLVEAAHYTLKLAERAAAAGLRSAKAARRKSSAKDSKTAATGSDGEGEPAATAVGAGRAEKKPSPEALFEMSKFVGEFVHPAVIQVSVHKRKHSCNASIWACVPLAYSCSCASSLRTHETAPSLTTTPRSF